MPEYKIVIGGQEHTIEGDEVQAHNRGNARVVYITPTTPESQNFAEENLVEAGKHFGETVYPIIQSRKP